MLGLAPSGLAVGPREHNSTVYMLSRIAQVLGVHLRTDVDPAGASTSTAGRAEGKGESTAAALSTPGRTDGPTFDRRTTAHRRNEGYSGSYEQRFP